MFSSPHQFQLLPPPALRPLAPPRCCDCLPGQHTGEGELRWPLEAQDLLPLLAVLLDQGLRGYHPCPALTSRIGVLGPEQEQLFSTSCPCPCMWCKDLRGCQRTARPKPGPHPNKPGKALDQATKADGAKSGPMDGGERSWPFLTI